MIMKKSLLFRLVALVAAMMCALSASADAANCDFSEDGIFYKIQSDGTTVHVWYEDINSWDPCYTRDDYNIPETVTHDGTTYTVTGIGSTAFYGCTAVTHVSLPKTLTRIDSEAFAGCTSLNSVYCHAMTPPALNSTAFDATAYSNVMVYVPASVTTAYASAENWSSFQNLTNLYYHFESGGLYYNITGTNTVSVVRKDSYYNDEVYYGAIDIPATVTNGGTTYNVTAISSQAFYRCWYLTEVNIGNNVTSIGSYAFQQCTSLTWVSIPGTVTAIGVYAFTHCTSLTSIICWATTPPTISTAFNGLFDQATLYVPASAVSTYQATTTWKNFSDIQPISSGGTEAYACYTPDNTTLTFYYDNLRSTRTGTTYDLNTGTNYTGWDIDGTKANVTRVVFNPSFAAARPTTTYCWFYRMTKLQDITGINYLNTSEVTNMAWMFAYCSLLTSLDLSHFNTAKVQSMNAMFSNCTALTSLDLSHFNTAEVTNMVAMFQYCSSLTSLDLSHFNTAKVTDMNNMFSYCNDLTSLDVSNFNTANVTNMRSMFYNCPNLTSLDLSHFNTAKVAYIYQMFAQCSGLTVLDLSSFNTAKITNIGYMFTQCSNLVTIYVGDGWNTDAVITSSGMFSGCTSLVGGKGTTYDENHVDKTYAHIDGGTSNPGYFTAAVSLDDVLNVEGGNIHFETGGEYPWILAIDDDGTVCARSSNEGVANSLSTLTATVTVTVPGTSVIQVFKARGEGTTPVYDACTFAVDGNVAFSFGEALGNYWATNNSTLEVGTHTLTWTYSKDSSVNPEGDFFAVSQVYLYVPASLRGDVDGNGVVNISDVTALINYLLTDDDTNVNLAAADVDNSNSVNISDVTTIINYLLTDNWPN